MEATQENALKYFSYCKDTGRLWRIHSNSNSVKHRLPKLVDGRDKEGYRVTYFAGRQYRAVRLIWLMVYGKEPEIGKLIDHKNLDKSDDRLENLRLLSVAGNVRNQAQATSWTKTKVVGVIQLSGKANPYSARIKVNGTSYELGRFPEQSLAMEIRKRFLSTKKYMK